ncbi:MAG: GntR family transcriptional regulator [Agathobacter rectalis]
MLTYDLTKTDGPLYKCLYECIKNDISQGKLSSGEKMPSKRTLAKNLGVSTITVENAYDQLIGEGYMFARLKRLFHSRCVRYQSNQGTGAKELSIKLPPEQDESIFDFSSNRTDSGNFPFSIWAKLMRETISLGSRSFCRCRRVAE